MPSFFFHLTHMTLLRRWSIFLLPSIVLDNLFGLTMFIKSWWYQTCPRCSWQLWWGPAILPQLLQVARGTLLRLFARIISFRHEWGRTSVRSFTLGSEPTEGFHEMAKSFAQNLRYFRANFIFANFCAIFAHETQWVLRGFALIFLRNLRKTGNIFLRKLRMKRNFSFAQFAQNCKFYAKCNFLGKLSKIDILSLELNWRFIPYSETLNKEYIGRIYQMSSWQFFNEFYTILRKFQYLRK